MFRVSNPISVDIPRQWADECEFITWQLERGEQGTPHLQGYFVLKSNPHNKNGRTIKWCRENIQDGVHYEKRMGTHQQAVDYCNKEDTRVQGPWTIGQWSDTEGQTRGGNVHKQTVSDLLKAVKEGADDEAIMEDFPRLFMSMTKGIEKARLVYAQKQPREQPRIIVYFGPTGTGKSHRAQGVADANGGGFTFRKGNSGNMWADGYDPLRHPVVIFDEMDGAFMPYRQLLRVCDKWPLVLDTKGGAVNFTPKIIIFTSHKHPKEWYSEESVKDTTELMRRLSGSHGAIIEMKETFHAPDENLPDLIDVIDLVENGEWSEEQAAQELIDLTADEELDPPCAVCSGGEDWVCDQCIDHDRDIGQTPPSSPGNWSLQRVELEDARKMNFVNQDDFDRDFPRSSQRVYNDSVSGLQRTLSFTATPTPAGQYKKAGTSVKQATLAFVPPRQSKRPRSNEDDDDDVTDKC